MTRIQKVRVQATAVVYEESDTPEDFLRRFERVADELLGAGSGWIESDNTVRILGASDVAYEIDPGDAVLIFPELFTILPDYEFNEELL